MEKEKNSRVAQTIIVAVLIICVSLIILQLLTNIHNELRLNF